MSGWFVSNANPNKLSQETLGPAISKIIGTLPVGTPFAWPSRNAYTFCDLMQVWFIFSTESNPSN